MKFFKNKKGFTLVELVVVIAILGILAGIAIPRFMDATASARGSKLVADLRTIDSAVAMYYAKVGDTTPPTMDLLTANGAYLAAEPVPQTGSAIIQKNATTSVKVTIKSASYTVGAATGSTALRGLIGGKSVDEVLSAAEAAEF